MFFQVPVRCKWSPLRQEPEAPLNIATSRPHPAITTAIAGVQGGTAYSRRLVLHGREEALSTPGGSRGMPRRGITSGGTLTIAWDVYLSADLRRFPVRPQRKWHESIPRKRSLSTGTPMLPHEASPPQKEYQHASTTQGL